MRLQLWSYNYDPEPTGIAPISTMLARQLSERGWDVDVVAAHPHYPEPRWGRRLRPYREIRDKISILRLPLWIGRETAAQRLRQEVSFASALTAALPFLGSPDAIVAASPSFPALAPAIAASRMRRVPLALWLHDILPDGAGASGLLDSGSTVMRAARRLEHSAYRAAKRIVLLSAAHVQNLREKGVPDSKLELIHDPASRGVPDPRSNRPRKSDPGILCMGNIGVTQGMTTIVRAFEDSEAMAERGVRLVIVGNGVAAGEARAQIRSKRVEMPGLVGEQRLERELRDATLALVSQRYEGTEFNLPSKLMNYMAYGLPVIAAVNPAGEVARLVIEANAGWVVDSSKPNALPCQVAAALDDPAERARRGAAAHRYALEHFSPEAFGRRFDRVLRNLIEAPR